MKKIGIIGNGFVGNSIAFGFSPTHEIRIHDKDLKRNLNTLEEVLECDFIFVAVPTPMNRDGSISLEVVKNALQEISEKNTRNNINILKSTMVPGSTNNFIKQFPKLNIVFNPEFLTERSAKLDFINQARFILGGHHYYMNKEIIQKNIKFNIPILMLTTFISLYCSNVFNIFDSTFIYNLSQGIVISHILYEELYIHKNRSNTNMTLIPY